MQRFYKLCLKEAILDFGGLTTLISQNTFFSETKANYQEKLIKKIKNVIFC